MVEPKKFKKPCRNCGTIFRPSSRASFVCPDCHEVKDNWREKRMMFKIPFKTPTINHLYWHRGNMRIMKSEAKELKEQIKIIVEKKLDSEPYKKLLNEDRLKVLIEVHEDWYTKKHEVKKKDISNREKFLVDAVFDALKIDDKFIFEHEMKKIQDYREFAVITIVAIDH